MVISGNQISNPSTVAMDIQAARKVTISDNVVLGQALAFRLGKCPNARITNNIFESSDTVNATNLFAAGNTGSFLSENNSLIGKVENASDSGVLISQFAAAAPTTGTWAVGDRVIQLTPVVGNPTGWRCTVAGTPGTWVSEGNL